ncbi:MAG: hypothetical protein R2795_11990 [Saprospiraceae bacterium]
MTVFGLMASFSFCLCTSFSIQVDAVIVKGEFFQMGADSINIRIQFDNATDEPIFLFLPQNTDNIKPIETFMSIDLGSSYITDPLAFPKYQVSLIPIFPKEPYTIEINYQATEKAMGKIYIEFDLIYLNKTSKKLNRKLRRITKNKK